MSTHIKISSNNAQKGSIKVAFATNDNQNIDAHFGKANQFNIYDISKDGYDLFSIIKSGQKDTDKTIDLLKQMDIVYFANIGPTAAAKIINKGVFPIKYKEIVSIEAEVDKLIRMLKENPPPFIKKILDKKTL